MAKSQEIGLTNYRDQKKGPISDEIGPPEVKLKRIGSDEFLTPQPVR